ncbi:hypothetical protein STEG23_024716, partial [Scotinomys teguina]
MYHLAQKSDSKSKKRKKVNQLSLRRVSDTLAYEVDDRFSFPEDTVTDTVREPPLALVSISFHRSKAGKSNTIQMDLSGKGRRLEKTALENGFGMNT